MPYTRKALDEYKASEWALEFAVTQLLGMRRCTTCGVPLQRQEAYCTLCCEVMYDNRGLPERGK